MKQLPVLAIMVILSLTAISQNVGIGETNPAAKLTVKGAGLTPSFLVKNGDDDSLIYQGFKNTHLGGFHLTSTGVATISNKNYLPLDPPQLELVAAGERIPGNANGSLAYIKFSNSNTSKYFTLDTYTGAETDQQKFSLSYYDPEDGSFTTRYLMYIDPNGRTGFGTYQPLGRFQINHRSTVLNPTLSLVDSSATNLPVIQLKSSGSDYWQVRGNMSQGAPALTYLDFATQAGIRMTLRGDGNLGIGNSSPGERLEVAGNVRITGEVNRTATGAANLVPIAYGQVNAAGNINNGSGNFSVTYITTGFYQITITGETFNFSQYVTVVTPIYVSTPVVAGTGSGSGNLHVRLSNLAGAAVDNIFSFVVYKQ